MQYRPWMAVILADGGSYADGKNTADLRDRDAFVWEWHSGSAMRALKCRWTGRTRRPALSTTFRRRNRRPESLDDQGNRDRSDLQRRLKDDFQSSRFTTQGYAAAGCGSEDTRHDDGPSRKRSAACSPTIRSRNSRRKSRPCEAAALSGCFVEPGRAADPGYGAAAGQPQTPPARDGSLPPRVQQPLDRLEESLATLGLSGEQKTQVQSIVDDGKKQLADVRAQVQNGSAKSDDMRAESQQIFAAMRDPTRGRVDHGSAAETA